MRTKNTGDEITGKCGTWTVYHASLYSFTSCTLWEASPASKKLHLGVLDLCCLVQCLGQNDFSLTHLETSMRVT